MRRPSGKIPKQPITHLWERHREIARRLVAGERQKDIAQDLGMTQSRISIVANSPEMQQAVGELSAKADEEAVDISARLQALSSDAVNVLEHVIKKNTSPFNESLQVKVAEAILDRAGYARAVKTEGSVNHKISAEGILGEALRTLRERAQGGVARLGGAEPRLIEAEVAEN